MPDSFHTTQLKGWLARLQAGDETARDELLRSVANRLEHLAHKMLRKFPTVQRWAQTDDVLQNALMRLLRSLQEVQPENTRAFFGLAAVQIRRELIDLSRHYGGKLGLAAQHDSVADADGLPARFEPAAPTEDAHDFERWQAFHLRVEQLPAQEREVVSLIFYHGWTQAEVAELFQVHKITVQRWWCAALLQLQDLMVE